MKRYRSVDDSSFFSRSLRNWRYPLWLWWQANLVGERLTSIRFLLGVIIVLECLNLLFK